MSKKSFSLPLVFVWLMLLSFAVLPSPALAVVAATTKPTHTQLMATYQTKRLEALRKRAISEITTRLTSLNKLSAKVSAMKWLSDSQKNAFIADINKNITDLTNLQNKVAADTDLATLQTDQKSITASFRIFAVFNPRLSILSQADAKLARIEALMPKLTKQPAIEKLTEAKALCSQAVDAVTPLTPEGYPANLSVLKTARADLKNAEVNIASARSLQKVK